MTTRLLQATAFQEFTDVIPAEIAAPMRPHLCGGHAQLFRYSVATEKANCSLGAYDSTTLTNYAWPNKPAGSTVDTSYAKLYADNALLRYYRDVTGGGDGTVAPVAGYSNRIATTATRGFITNTASYPRLAALYDRDVQIGDTVKLVGGSPSQTLVATVADIIATPVAAVVGTATSDANNGVTQPNNLLGTTPTVNATGGGAGGGSLAAGDYYLQYTFVGTWGETWGSPESTQFSVSAGNIPRVTLPTRPAGVDTINIYLTQADGASGTETLYATGVTATTYDLTAAHTTGTAAVPLDIEQTAGTSNDVAASADDSSYRGDVDGDLTETYTITVITGSTGGDATTAVLRVTSASGRDDVASVTPAAFSSATAIGTRGLEVTFTNSSNDFVVGQIWRVVARQSWTKPTPTSGGSYAGSEIDKTFTYRVEVTRGGYYADASKPQITVSRTDGADSSGPTNVTAHSTAIVVGTQSVTVSFSSTSGLRKGDVFYIPITSKKNGAYKTLVLSKNMNATMLAASDLELSLYIKKSGFAIPTNRLSDPPTTNWSVTTSQVTVNSNIDATDSTLTNNGVAVYVPVESADLYIEYRAWLTTYNDTLASYTPSSTDAIATEVAALLGTVHPDNPLAYGVYKAAQNANLQKIYFTSVANPDTTALWDAVLSLLEGEKDIMSLVPLTTNTTIRDAYITHINARSLDTVGGEWRFLWFSPPAVETQAIVTSATTTDNENALGTLSDDPDTAGTQYTKLDCTSLNGQFVTNGVAAGDVVRLLYTQDSFGVEIYTEFVVQSVVNEDSLILSTGHNAAISTPARFEIHRPLTNAAIATSLASTATTLNNKRVRLVWPDTIEADGYTVSGYFAAAALAAATGGLAPHQSLRNMTLTGFTGTTRSTSFFNNAQLNTLINAGYTVLTTENSQVFVSRARTTKVAALVDREEMITRNYAAIQYLFYSRLASFFGAANTSPGAMATMRSEVTAAQQILLGSTNIPRLGTMILDGSIASFIKDPDDDERVILTFTVTLPSPAGEAAVVLVL